MPSFRIVFATISHGATPTQIELRHQRQLPTNPSTWPSAIQCAAPSTSCLTRSANLQVLLLQATAAVADDTADILLVLLLLLLLLAALLLLLMLVLPLPLQLLLLLPLVLPQRLLVMLLCCPRCCRCCCANFLVCALNMRASQRF